MDRHVSHPHLLEGIPNTVTGEAIEFITPGQEQLERLEAVQSQVVAHRATIESLRHDIGETAADELIGDMVAEYTTDPDRDNRAIEDAILAGAIMLESAEASGERLATAAAMNRLCDADENICGVSLVDAEQGGVDVAAVTQKLDESRQHLAMQLTIENSAAQNQELIQPTEQIQSLLQDVRNRFRQESQFDAGDTGDVMQISQELARAISKLTNPKDQEKVIREVAATYYLGGRLSPHLSLMASKFLKASLQDREKQSNTLRAWIDGSVEAEGGDSASAGKRALTGVLLADLPFSEEGASYVKDRALSLDNYDMAQHDLCFASIDGDRIDSFHPAAKQTLVEVLVDTYSTGATSLVRYMDTDQQKKYLRGIASRAADEQGYLYKASFDYIDAQGVRLSVGELEEIAKLSGHTEMMLMLGARGVEGVDVMQWIEPVMQQWAPHAREGMGGFRAGSVISSMHERKQKGEVSEEQYWDFLRSMYHTALDNQMYSTITTGVRLVDAPRGGVVGFGAALPSKEVSPFLEIMTESGDDYVDLYRLQCQQLVHSGNDRFYFLPVTELLEWAGGVEYRLSADGWSVQRVPNVALARRLFDAGLEEMGSRTVDLAISDLGWTNTSPDRMTILLALDMSDDQLVRHIAEKGRAIDLVDTLGKEVPCIDRWVSDGGLSKVIESLAFDSLSEGDFARTMQALDAHRGLFADTVMSDEAKGLQRIVRQTQQIMPAGVTREGFLAVRRLQSGELPDALREMGIDRTGASGIEQLRSVIAGITQEIQQINPSAAIIEHAQHNALYRSILASQYRLGEAEFGRRGASVLGDIMQRHKDMSGEIQTMRPEFVAKTFQVEKADSYSGEVSLTVDTQERIETLSADVQVAAAEDGKQTIIYELAAIVADQQSQLIRDLEAIDAGADEQYARLNEKAQLYYRRNATDRLAGVRQTQQMLQSGEYTFVDLFEQLHALESCSTSLRRLAMVDTLQSVSDEYKAELLAIRSDTAGVAEVRTMKEFVEGLQGAYSFTSKKTQKSYGAMMSPGAFKDQLERYANDQLRAQEMTVSFVPTRGIGMDLSGYVGDACWANIDESIAHANPNVTAVIMKRQFSGRRQDRLIGSAIMIEAKDESGRDILVMRGVNPIENQINKMSRDSFLDAAEAYCRTVAHAMGYEPAIVVDNAVGGAATNRPLLFDAMKQRYGHGMYADISITDPRATFNDHQLKGIVKSLAKEQ